MADKTVLILANSIRVAPNACVAGKEVIGKSANLALGGWIRPISAHGDGELSPAERRTSDGREVRVLNIVQMKLGEHVPDNLQPENWRLVTPPQWVAVGAGTLAHLEAAKDTPPDLWRDPNGAQDRVSAGHIENAPLAQSLYLIEVPSVELRVSREDYGLANPRTKRRALFTYRNTKYDLAFTDPNLQHRYPLAAPNVGAPPTIHNINHPCYLCISLAHQPWNSFHYKLLAALIDPEFI